MDGKIYIPKPCHENWNKMTPEEKGRHCAVCSKVVKDFTSMKKTEIIDVLKTTEGEVCGRINVKEITPTNQKQKLYFLVNGWLYRKAIYPVMALLGFTLVSKKATAQIDYPLKGKVAYNDYHTSSKRITIVVKSNHSNSIIQDATVEVVSGVVSKPSTKKTDANGKTILDIDANNLSGDVIELEIYAGGYEPKTVTIQLIKNVQTVEVVMEHEVMIMGEMMYVPENEPELAPVIKDIDSLSIDTIRYSMIDVIDLPYLPEEIQPIEPIDGYIPEDIQEPKDQLFDKIVETNFEIYPNPATEFINITTTATENFNLDLFDESGKKLQSVMNGNGRYHLDVSNYSGGMYYMVITVNGKAVETKKIVVTR